MSYYKNQPFHYIIGTSAAGATLTTAYSGNTNTDDTRGYNLATIYVEYVPQENDSDCYIQIEAGIDDSNLYPKIALIDEDTSGESVIKGHIFKLEAVTAGTAVKRRILIELADRKLRVSAKETTSGTAGAVTIVLQRNEE